MNMMKSKVVQDATRLYHRKMREAHVARLLRLENDKVVQFFLAGLEVQRRDILSQLGSPFNWHAVEVD